MEAIKFSTTINSIPVEIDGKQYSLNEATGDQAAKWRNTVLSCAVMGKDGKPSGFRNLANTDSVLVALCLVDAEGKQVDLQEVRSWPGRMVKSLFDTIKKMSGLDEDELSEDEAKNELSETTDGSV